MSEAAAGIEEHEDAPGRRRCIASGESEARLALLRFVVAPEGKLVPDVAGRLPGRGLWVGARRDLVEMAVKKKLFSKAARQEVAVPGDLAGLVETLIAKRLGEHLGLAKRAGQAVSGFDKVAEMVEGGEAGLLLIAAEAAPNGREKMRRLGAGLPRIELMTNRELSLAMGRENVVHAAVARGTFVDRLTAESLRLAGFRQAQAEHARATG